VTIQQSSIGTVTANPASASAPSESRWFMLVVVLLVAALFRIVYLLPSRANQNDFAHYYLSSRFLIDGEDPYRVPLKPYYETHGFVYNPRIPSATNPPLLLLVFAPLSLLPPGIAFWLWAGLNGASLAVGLVLTRRLVCADWPATSWWLAVAAVLWSFPILDHFAYSQVQLEIGALLLGAFHFQRTGKPGLGCALAAIAAVLKLFPVLVLPWFVFHSARNGKEIGRRVFIVGTVWLVAFLATGPALWQGFVQSGLPVISDWVMNQWGNLSLPSLVYNIASVVLGDAFTAQSNRFWWSIASLSGVALIAAAYAWVWASRTDSRIRFGVVVLAMVLSGTTAWTHYYVLLIWPSFVAVDLARTYPGMVRRVLTAIMGLLLVVPIGGMAVAAAADQPFLVNVFLGYMAFYGAILAGGLLMSAPAPTLSPSAD
jgi:hypothetical protein